MGLPDLPECVVYLAEMIGPAGGLQWCQNNGFGASPVSWSEIYSFSRCAAPDLEPWELQQLRAMSTAYVEQLHRGKTPMARAPVYDKDEDDPAISDQRKDTADQLKALSLALSGSKGT